MVDVDPAGIGGRGVAVRNSQLQKTAFHFNPVRHNSAELDFFERPVPDRHAERASAARFNAVVSIGKRKTHAEKSGCGILRSAVGLAERRAQSAFVAPDVVRTVFRPEIPLPVRRTIVVLSENGGVDGDFLRIEAERFGGAGASGGQRGECK